MSKERFKVVPAVYLVLMKDEKVLMLQRANTGYHDGEYSLPAGHVDGGESSTDALMREAKEESGIILHKENIRMKHVMHRPSDMDRSEERVDFFFVATQWHGEIINTEPEKCSDLSWFSLQQLPDNTIPYVRQALEYIQKDITYSEFGWE